MVGCGDEALEFIELCVALSVGESTGVEFDHVRTEGEGGVDLSRIGLDEHADAGAGVAQSADGWLEEVFEADDVEAAFGGDFFAIFGDETGFMGMRLEGDLDNFRCVSHLEVEAEAGLGAEVFDVCVLDVASIGAEVDGDSDGACGEALASCFEDEGFCVMGERVLWVARLAHGGDVIDIDAEVGHALFLGRLVAEVAGAGENHGHAAFVGGGDDFFVADGAAGLDGAGGSGVGGCEETVGEGEECVASDGAAFQGESGVTCFPDGHAGGVDTGHLTGTDAEGAVGAGVDDGVALDVFDDAPSERHGSEFLFGGLAFCDDFGEEIAVEFG